MSANQTLTIPYSGLARASFDFWGSPVLTNNNGELYCPGFVGETYMVNPEDFLYLGLPLTRPFTPGVADVQIESYRDVDKKKAAGGDGARVTIHGLEPADVTVSIVIWTPEQLRVLQNIWTILFPKAQKGSPPAYDIQHPRLKFHGVKSLQFVRGSGPHPGPIARSRVFTMRAIEFLKPSQKKTSKTEVASIKSKYDPKTTDHPKPGSVPGNTGP